MQNHEQKKKSGKKWKTKFLWTKQNIFLAPCASALRKYRKNELSAHFQQKFAMGSYKVGIGRAWCSRKACEICSSLV
jgi:hypothetical protein